MALLPLREMCCSWQVSCEVRMRKGGKEGGREDGKEGGTKGGSVVAFVDLIWVGKLLAVLAW
eukprot:21216-Chlamydomonas_euryale.AAC.7